MTTDTQLRTAPVAWATYRPDGRNLRPSSRTHLVDVTDAADHAHREILEGSPETLCGAVVPDPWDAKLDLAPTGGTCHRCHLARLKLRGATAQDVPTTASTRPRRPDRPADLDAELGLYRRAAEIAERLLEGGLVLTEARSVRLADDGLVAGELLLPRATDPDAAYALGGELLRLVGAVSRFDVSRDTTGRIRLVLDWTPTTTSAPTQRRPR